MNDTDIKESLILALLDAPTPEDAQRIGEWAAQEGNIDALIAELDSDQENS
jgi:hypothetical protein